MVLFFEISRPLQLKLKLERKPVMYSLLFLWFRIGVFRVPFSTIYVGTAVEKELLRMEAADETPV